VNQEVFSSKVGIREEKIMNTTYRRNDIIQDLDMILQSFSSLLIRK
jgi:hypothetical protein